MSEKDVAPSTPPQRPTTDDRKEWGAFWQQKGQSWRTEPEIDNERQTYLTDRRSIAPDVELGMYPFKDITLSRADVEWLLATHENGRDPSTGVTKANGNARAWMYVGPICGMSI